MLADWCRWITKMSVAGAVFIIVPMETVFEFGSDVEPAALWLTLFLFFVNPITVVLVSTYKGTAQKAPSFLWPFFLTLMFLLGVKLGYRDVLAGYDIFPIWVFALGYLGLGLISRFAYGWLLRVLPKRF